MIQRSESNIWRATPATPATRVSGTIHQGMPTDGLASRLTPTPVLRADNVALTVPGLATPVPPDLRFGLRQVPKQRV
jgi:hypothetical protein